MRIRKKINTEQLIRPKNVTKKEWDAIHLRMATKQLIPSFRPSVGRWKNVTKKDWDATPKFIKRYVYELAKPGRKLSAVWLWNNFK